MRTAFRLTLLLLLLHIPPAYATVLKCVGADGSVTYTNERSPGSHCTRLDSDLPISTIPAPKRAPASATPAATPATEGFPRVSPDAQRSRDDTRRQILEKELEAELKSLETANAALAEQLVSEDGAQVVPSAVLDPYRDQIKLHERNIDALQREIRGLR